MGNLFLEPRLAEISGGKLQIESDYGKYHLRFRTRLREAFGCAAGRIPGSGLPEFYLLWPLMT